MASHSAGRDNCEKRSVEELVEQAARPVDKISPQEFNNLISSSVLRLTGKLLAIPGVTPVRPTGDDWISFASRWADFVFVPTDIRLFAEVLRGRPPQRETLQCHAPRGPLLNILPFLECEELEVSDQEAAVNLAEVTGKLLNDVSVPGYTDSGSLQSPLLTALWLLADRRKTWQKWTWLQNAESHRLPAPPERSIEFVLHVAYWITLFAVAASSRTREKEADREPDADEMFATVAVLHDCRIPAVIRALHIGSTLRFSHVTVDSEVSRIMAPVSRILKECMSIFRSSTTSQLPYLASVDAGSKPIVPHRVPAMQLHSFGEPHVQLSAKAVDIIEPAGTMCERSLSTSFWDASCNERLLNGVMRRSKKVRRGRILDADTLATLYEQCARIQCSHQHTTKQKISSLLRARERGFAVKMKEFSACPSCAFSEESCRNPIVYSSASPLGYTLGEDAEGDWVDLKLHDLMSIAEPEWLVVEASVYRRDTTIAFRSEADRELIHAEKSWKAGYWAHWELDRCATGGDEGTYRKRVEEHLLSRSSLSNLYSDPDVWRTINGCISSTDPEENHQILPELVPRDWRVGFGCALNWLTEGDCGWISNSIHNKFELLANGWKRYAEQAEALASWASRAGVTIQSRAVKSVEGLHTPEGHWAVLEVEATGTNTFILLRRNVPTGPWHVVSHGSIKEGVMLVDGEICEDVNHYLEGVHSV